MIRIKCFADFTTSAQLQEDYVSKSFPLRNRYNQWFVFTTDEDYTHAFIFNTAMPNLHIPKKNVIGFAHEPLPFLKLSLAFIEYAKKHIGRYYIGDKGQLPDPFKEGNAYLCYLPPTLRPPPTKFMSIMISQKLNAPGHKYRHALVQAILKTTWPIDIYGRGCVYYPPDARIKGEFQSTELYDGYTFTICIENFRSNHYFSEKIINPLNQQVIPVYLGCYKIHHYFPGMYVELTGNVKEDLRRIGAIYQNPKAHIRPISLERVDRTINLLRNIPTILNAF